MRPVSRDMLCVLHQQRSVQRRLYMQRRILRNYSSDALSGQHRMCQRLLFPRGLLSEGVQRPLLKLSPHRQRRKVYTRGRWHSGSQRYLQSRRTVDLRPDGTLRWKRRLPSAAEGNTVRDRVVVRRSLHANFCLRRGRNVRDSPSVKLRPVRLRRRRRVRQRVQPRQHLHEWFLLHRWRTVQA
jgi:hypothetical protein